jgi:hypothetical protein
VLEGELMVALEMIIGEFRAMSAVATNDDRLVRSAACPWIRLRRLVPAKANLGPDEVQLACWIDGARATRVQLDAVKLL